ncbi:MAG: hypothetical protein R3C49_06960 [Planctomycetaceae bacterium]
MTFSVSVRPWSATLVSLAVLVTIAPAQLTAEDAASSRPGIISETGGRSSNSEQVIRLSKPATASGWRRRSRVPVGIPPQVVRSMNSKLPDAAILKAVPPELPNPPAEPPTADFDRLPGAVPVPLPLPSDLSVQPQAAVGTLRRTPLPDVLMEDVRPEPGPAQPRSKPSVAEQAPTGRQNAATDSQPRMAPRLAIADHPLAATDSRAARKILILGDLPVAAEEAHQLMKQEAAKKSSDRKDSSKPTEKSEKQDVSWFDLPLSRSLSSVTLFDSLVPETPNGTELKVPEDQGAELYASFGSVYDSTPAVIPSGPARNWFQTYHQPLYFEDPNLERCGIHHGCLTDAVSLLWFFGRVPAVPYMVGSQPPCQCVPSLGDCPLCHAYDHTAYLPPPNVRGAVFQAVCTVGMVFLIP